MLIKSLWRLEWGHSLLFEIEVINFFEFWDDQFTKSVQHLYSI